MGKKFTVLLGIGLLALGVKAMVLPSFTDWHGHYRDLGDYHWIFALIAMTWGLLLLFSAFKKTKKPDP
jgi:hypothetical protein